MKKLYILWSQSFISSHSKLCSKHVIAMGDQWTCPPKTWKGEIGTLQYLSWPVIKCLQNLKKTNVLLSILSLYIFQNVMNSSCFMLVCCITSIRIEELCVCIALCAKVLYRYVSSMCRSQLITNASIMQIVQTDSLFKLQHHFKYKIWY